MATFPTLARVTLLDAAPLARTQTPRLIIVHTHGGPGSPEAIRNYFNRPGNSVYSHFDVGWDGDCVQMQDTGRVAAAQWDANPYAVSIESQDDSKPLTPWSDAQVRKITDLIRAVAAVHSIPLRLAEKADGSGIGWHSMYPAWNHSAHNCPGPVREAQLRDVILPALYHAPSTPPTDWLDMATQAEVQAAIEAGVVVGVCRALKLPESGLAVPYGQPHNGNLGVNIAGGVAAANAALRGVTAQLTDVLGRLAAAVVGKTTP